MVVLDLSREEPADTLKISWAEPYAKSYLLQYWTGVNPLRFPAPSSWVKLPQGVITAGKGGLATHRLSTLPLRLRYLRISMTQSSSTCNKHGSGDPRNCVGYPIEELYLGTSSKDGGFHNLLRHTADQEQMATLCSSVDPWHTEQAR